MMLAGRGWWMAGLVWWAAGVWAAEAPVVMRHDFDRDGVEERVVSRAGADEIERFEAGRGAWVPAGYGWPEGVARLDQGGGEAGLRLVDLNGDGFKDVLYSNERRYAIYLWTKTVRLDLGWTPGWSQFVREGERKGRPGEPPPVVGAEVEVREGTLVVRWPGGGGVPAREERMPVRDLIAFEMPPPRSPEEGLRSLRVREGFRVELVAAEPVVVDPIAFEWGADGRLWVVEMSDYPVGMDGRGKPGGVVKVLEDGDGDGRYERATRFLEGLPFPTSAMPWRSGLLVAAAPDVFWAEDTDGDGRADRREVLFTGFEPGNQQHRFNGFEWGLDGWIYAANGDSGGTVKSLKTGQTLSISGRDFRFRPDTGEMETVSGQTQYGRRRDDWGHWFGNNNPTWLWQVTLPEHYLRRNPRLAVKRVLHVLANYEDSTRVYPISAPMVRPNQPWSLNHVTSACSPCPYRDDLFGEEFGASVFISEPVHNAVHREVLWAAGAGFTSRRAPGEEQSEFLASTDNWFRPVTVKTGPDGALYVADMYRFVIEHPEWISPEMQARLDLRAGDDRGRLYRVVPVGRERRGIPNLAVLAGRELALAMDSPSGWQRDTVQRLLYERRDRGGVEVLRAMLGARYAPQVRLQAMASLGLLEELSEAEVLRMLADPHPAVRVEALRQSEAWGGRSEALLAAVVGASASSDPGVREQAAFTLGAWRPEQAERWLGELAAREDADEGLRVAVMSSLRPESELFRRLRANEPLPKAAELGVVLRPSSEDRAEVLAGYAGVGKLRGDALRGQEHFQALCQPCHRFKGEGREVGADLGMVSNKPVDWLLRAILDPSQVVEARYRAWAITLKSGEELSGLIAAETANNLVVRMTGGVDYAVLRSEIASMEPQTVSLMPSGFESALKPQDMADLLEWLRSP